MNHDKLEYYHTRYRTPHKNDLLANGPLSKCTLADNTAGETVELIPCYRQQVD